MTARSLRIRHGGQTRVIILYKVRSKAGKLLCMHATSTSTLFTQDLPVSELTELLNSVFSFNNDNGEGGSSGSEAVSVIGLQVGR